MNIYVAGSSKDLDHVKVVQRLVERLGHSITYDWVPDVEAYGPGARTEGLALSCALKDLKGVMTSDLMILVAHHRLWGGMFEVGAAVASHTPVWICEEWESIRYSVFFELSHIIPGCSLQRIERRLTRCHDTGPVQT